MISVCCVMRLATAVAGASRKCSFLTQREALTNCLKGWTITALTSDMLRYLVAAVAVAIWVAAATAQPLELRRLCVQRSIYSSSGLQTRR